MARIGSGYYGMPGGIRRPIIDQAWYEKAADIIGSSVSTAEERLSTLNEIWQEYLLETNEFHHPRQQASFKLSISDDDLFKAMKHGFKKATGYTIDEIVKYAKAKKESDLGIPVPRADSCEGCDGRSSIAHGLPYQCLYCCRNYGDKHDKKEITANGTNETNEAAADSE